MSRQNEVFAGTQNNRVAARVDAAMKSAMIAASLLRRPVLDEGTVNAARTAANEATEAARAALGVLVAEGATLAPLPRLDGGVPIHLLDTPANRALLAALDAAVHAAEAVDKERGQSVAESDRLAPSDTLGVDLAEEVNQIRARVFLEVHGAAGRGLE